MLSIFRRRHRGSPPSPPAHMMPGVGPGDFWKIGETTVELVSEWAGLRRSDRVLDVGCGMGRIAWPLSHHLGRRGRYVGFDVVLKYVAWCQEQLGLDPQRFFFCYYPLHSTAYSESGEIAPEHFEFPWEPGLFTLAIATSLFTHLLPEATGHYLQQMRRVLKPGGRVFASFFLVDEGSRGVVEAGTTYPRFTERHDWGWLHNPAVPEDGVAFEKDWLLPLFEKSGLRVRSVHPGSWRGPSAPYYQDVIVATAV